jgi:hypothetical protein
MELVRSFLVVVKQPLISACEFLLVLLYATVYITAPYRLVLFYLYFFGIRVL